MSSRSLAGLQPWASSGAPAVGARSGQQTCVSLNGLSRQQLKVWYRPDVGCRMPDESRIAPQSAAEGPSAGVIAFLCARCNAECPAEQLSADAVEEVLSALVWRGGRPQPNAVFDGACLCRRCQAREWAQDSPRLMLWECWRRNLCYVDWTISVHVRIPGGSRLYQAEHHIPAGAAGLMDLVRELMDFVARRIVDAMAPDGTFVGVSYPSTRQSATLAAPTWHSGATEDDAASRVEV